METGNEMSQETSKIDDSHEKKIDNELTSDRESSVESFHTNKSEISTTAETEIIDVDDIELSDEESWLYKSPKRLPNADKALNTCKWIQNDTEHMDDNTMLSITKNALVSKLSQLQMLKADSENQTAKDSMHMNKKIFTKVSHPDIDKTLSETGSESSNSTASKVQEIVETSKKPLEQNSVSGKENEVLDVVDVHKIAQLQEESLRQSTCRFLTLERGEKKSYDKNNFLMQNPKLSKPVSVESLNLCNGKLEESPYNLTPLHKMKRINGYGSSSSLHNTQDAHRGSLPNINPGYYSLRSKKSKKHIDKMGFPLPICPSRLPLNGAGSCTPPHESQPKPTSPSMDHQSQTLPSSYRIHSRNNSSSRRELNTPSPRRESTSFLPNPRSSPSFARRESAPAPKNVSPLASPTLYQRSHGISSPALQSPTKSFRQRDSAMSPTEYHRRNVSPSPSRRLPLMTMHNRAAPKGGSSPASPRHEELRGFKVQSRIPSPGPVSRSGIPVPSSYMARVNSDDESWSNDCY